MSESTKSPNSRRDFIKTGGVGLFTAWAASSVLGKASSARAADAKPLEMVKESDPMAKTLGYHEDATKVDTKKWAKRAGPAGAKQFCYNCQFYAEKNKPKESKAAACTIFAAKGVKSHGWCNSWTQDPKIKD